MSPRLCRKWKRFANDTVKRRWSIYAGGENLTNFRQKNPVVSAADPYSRDFDATMVWGPTMGYKLYAGIRFNIPKM